MPPSITNHTKLFSETGHTTNQSSDTPIPDDFTGYVVEYARDQPSKDVDPSSNFISDTLLSYTEYSTGKPDGLSINVVDSNHQKSQFFIQGHLMASTPTNFNIPKLAGYQEEDKFDSDTHSTSTLEDLGINKDNLKSSLLTPSSTSPDSTIDLDQMESLISDSILSGKMGLQDATHLASVLNSHIADLSTPESYQEPDNLFQGP